MAITKAGMYGPTLEKMFIDTAGESMEAEDNKELMVTDSYTPNFTTHDFRNDITNEVSGAGYSAGGVAVTSTEITLTGDVLTFDAADTVFTTVTVTSAMAGVLYFVVGADTTDQLVLLQDFVTAASSTAANFTIQHSATGILTVAFAP